MACSAQRLPGFSQRRSFHGIPTSFQAGCPGFPERSLLLLGGGTLLLLGLLIGLGMLATALSAGCDGARCSASPGIATDEFAHDGPARGSAQSGSRCRAGGGGLGLGGSLRGGWASGVKTCLLHGPRITRRLIGFLLFGRLPFGGLDVLLGDGHRQRRDGQGNKN